MEVCFDVKRIALVCVCDLNKIVCLWQCKWETLFLSPALLLAYSLQVTCIGFWQIDGISSCVQINFNLDGTADGLAQVAGLLDAFNHKPASVQSYHAKICMVGGIDGGASVTHHAYVIYPFPITCGSLYKQGTREESLYYRSFLLKSSGPWASNAPYHKTSAQLS